jgi:hypothetical protein
LDVAVGLAIVFFVFSTICSMVREGIAQILHEREQGLLAGIRTIVGASVDGKSDPKDMAKKVLGHALVRGTGYDRGGVPSYVSGRNFSLALTHVLTGELDPGGTTAPSVDNLRAAVAKLQIPALRDALVPIFDAAGADVAKVQQLVAQFYDETMGRISGWYKRRTQLWLALTAAIVAGVGNVDAIAIASSLFREPVVRAHTVAMAAEVVRADPSAAATSAYDQAAKSLGAVHLPLGWTEWPADPKAWSLKVAGLLITVVALMLGAPFWFDVLSKIGDLRWTSPKPAHAKEPQP